jgi:hypothetical protein
MSLVKIFAGLSLLSVMGFQDVNKVSQRRYLDGVVVDKQTNEPLPDVYVYTVKGEEEAITNENGKFNFSTWQDSDLVLYIKRLNFQEVKVKIADSKKTVVIRL